LSHVENANLTHKDLNTGTDMVEHWWNIHLVSFDTLTSRAKQWNNGQLCYYLWSFGIFDEYHRYKTQNSAGWQIAITVRIGFILHVTATSGFPSLHDQCDHMIWLFSGAAEDPEDNRAMEEHRADTLDSAANSMMHVIWTEEEEAEQDMVHRMIQIPMPWIIWRWSESKLANGKPLVQIPTGNGPLIDLEWTEDQQVKLKIPVERYTSQSPSGAWRVHQRELVHFH
jgi:hypothetical protein